MNKWLLGSLLPMQLMLVLPLLSGCCGQDSHVGTEGGVTPWVRPAAIAARYKMDHDYLCVVVQARGVEYVYLQKDVSGPPVLICSYPMEKTPTPAE